MSDDPLIRPLPPKATLLISPDVRCPSYKATPHLTSGLIRRVAFGGSELIRGSSDIWPDKRGGLGWGWPLEGGSLRRGDN
jgi:hypothetical protein